MTSQKELVALWIAAGYRKSMASATITPPPPKAFRPVYHMMKSKWALVAIDDQRLKVSRIEDLNDPFELLGMNRHTQASRKVSKRFRAAFSESQGLLCFGADWSNSVMWSHYSEKHKGICLGFDVRRGMLQEVQYEDRRLRVALGDSADPPSLGPKLQHQLTCTKAKAWSVRRGIQKVYRPPLQSVPFRPTIVPSHKVRSNGCSFLRRRIHCRALSVQVNVTEGVRLLFHAMQLSWMQVINICKQLVLDRLTRSR